MKTKKAGCRVETRVRAKRDGIVIVGEVLDKRTLTLRDDNGVKHKLEGKGWKVRADYSPAPDRDAHSRPQYRMPGSATDWVHGLRHERSSSPMRQGIPHDNDY